MKSKTKTITVYGLSGFIAVIIGLTATLKLASHPQIVTIYAGLGLSDYLPMLGLSELTFVVLFLWKRTMKVGFLLLTGYFGGAMAVEISHQSLFVLPAAILCMIWVVAFLRDPFIFKSTIGDTMTYQTGDTI
jgi:hypothetical protein